MQRTLSRSTRASCFPGAMRASARLLYSEAGRYCGRHGHSAVSRPRIPRCGKMWPPAAAAAAGRARPRPLAMGPTCPRSEILFSRRDTVDRWTASCCQWQCHTVACRRVPDRLSSRLRFQRRLGGTCVTCQSLASFGGWHVRVRARAWRGRRKSRRGASRPRSRCLHFCACTCSASRHAPPAVPPRPPVPANDSARARAVLPRRVDCVKDTRTPRSRSHTRARRAPG